MSDKKIERTLVLVKPDGVERGLIGEIIKRFEKHGCKIDAMKMTFATKELLEQHYYKHNQHKFFDQLIAYMTSGPIVALIVSGVNMINTCREIVGSTVPSEADPGTIRSDLASSVFRNLVHSSESPEVAKREIGLWFKDEDHVHWDPSWKHWILSAAEHDLKHGDSY